MAVREMVVSDISSQEGASPSHYNFDGQWYRIDLTEAERQEFAQAMQPYLDVSRRVVGTSRPPSQPVARLSIEQRVAIRKWGEANGFDVPHFGRIPKKLLAAYSEAVPSKRAA